MLCDICGKRPATVHLTEIINGKVKEVHLCEECARKKSEQLQVQFNIADFLYDFVNASSLETEKQEKEICPNCGLSYLDFKKQGKFGCSRCYDVFKPKILPLLQKIHGSIQHRGKYPSIKEYRHLSLRQKIESLKKYLARAVKLEEYEEAARLRDQIRELEKKIQKDKGNV